MNFSYDSAAILVTFLTLANGVMSLINGVQWFTAGGSLASGQDASETVVGVIIDGMSVFNLVLLYSRLKRVRFVVLPWGALYALVPPASLFVLGVFLAMVKGKADTQSNIAQFCDASITDSPFTDVSESELRQVCIQENNQYLSRTVIFTFVRAVFQVFLSTFIAIWTYYRVIELRGNRKPYEFGDNQAIPFTTNAAPLGKSGYDVYVEGGQFVNKPPYVAPPYTVGSYPQGPQPAYQPPPYPPASARR